jgi:hypothetical protein
MLYVLCCASVGITTKKNKGTAEMNARNDFTIENPLMSKCN